MFLSKRFLYCILSLLGLYCCGEVFGVVFALLIALCVLFVVCVMSDLLVLYLSPRGKMEIRREVSRRLSCGDEERVKITIVSPYSVSLGAIVVDELPEQLQIRDNRVEVHLDSDKENVATYTVVPNTRGEYTFGVVNVFVHTRLHLIERRYRSKDLDQVKVYPSFRFISDAQLLSPENKHSAMGLHNVRQRGQNTQFDTIREYYPSDDYRSINWHATARRNLLMVNQYTLEKSQNIISVVDKGRGMQHVFNGLTLLDHSINATIRLAYSALANKDCVGLMTLEREVSTYVSTDSNHYGNVKALQRLIEVLYREQSTYAESDYSALMNFVQSKVSRRSLIVIFTTFDSMVSLRRQLPFLRHMARAHAVLVVFFEDEDMKELAVRPHETSSEYIASVLAHKAIHEKKLMVNELRRNGIASLLTTPRHLSSAVINRYYDMKRYGAI